MLLLRFVVLVAGAWLTLWTILQALRSFVLPRPDRALLTDIALRSTYWLLAARFKPHTSFATKDRILALHPVLAMFSLRLIWLTLITVGYTGIYWAISPDLGLRDCRRDCTRCGVHHRVVH